MKGTVISADEVKARWAYDEVASIRFGQTFKQNLPSALYETAMRREPFGSVGREHWPTLVSALQRARSREFVDCIDTFGAPQYRCAEWSVSDLLHSTVLPTLGFVPYAVFLARPVMRRPDGAIDDVDPRHVSQTMPFDPKFAPSSPLIAIAIDGKPMLIEGYLRSILWLRNPAGPLPVWVPDAASKG